MASSSIVTTLDHLVLTCTDVSTTVNWYTHHLGMTSETFYSPKDPSIARISLRYGQGDERRKINLHQSGKEFEPKAKHVMTGSADLCFIVREGVDLEELKGKFKSQGVKVEEDEKIVERIGSRGLMKSIYVRDPDGNLIELSKYNTSD